MISQRTIEEAFSLMKNNRIEINSMIINIMTLLQEQKMLRVE
jgi:hypothetical protein